MFSVVMTALVLACPFLECQECCGTCPVHVAAVASGHEGHEPCCDLHSQAADLGQTGPQEPEPCDHRCPHSGNDKDCLCNGAIIPGTARCPDHDRDIAYAVAVFTDASVVSPFAAEHAETFSFCHGASFSPLISGREIRTLVGSLLL
jgi:hypothetical protein